MTTLDQTVNIGFIPLVDCALLAIAKEKEFAKKQSIDLQLHKEVSWANIRDKLYLGYFDGAQMLAPMTIAANLGLMPNSTEIVAPFVLGRNGNAITVSHDLYKAMCDEEGDLLEEMDLRKTGTALKKVIEKRRVQKKSQLHFGMVFPFSCHNYHLRYWMASCGIDPDQDVHLEVIPPPFMDRYLGEGRIDGFCVGEPWSSLAVAQDIGVMVATTSQIWAQCPEKLLGLRKDWADAHPLIVKGLIKALHQASLWAGQQENLAETADILSGHEYLEVPGEIILRALSGQVKLYKGASERQIVDFLILSGDEGNRPTRGGAEWVFEQMQRWGHTGNLAPVEKKVDMAFCSNIYDNILGSPLCDPK